MFFDDLFSVIPKREIRIHIDLFQDTLSISIPPYHMAPTELKELKDLLKYLLDKGFIKSSISLGCFSIVYS